MTSKKCISIVLPAYQEEKNIFPTYQELLAVLSPLADTYDYEIIYVNDGSSDATWSAIVHLCQQDPHVKWINLTRNFGKELALFAWVSASIGDATMLMDVDGQRPSALILEFVEKWETGHAIVCWVRTKMKRSWMRRIASSLFNRIMKSISQVDFSTGITDFMLLDRKIIPYILQYTNRNIIFRWIVLELGFPVEKVFFEEPPRRDGTSWFGFKKLYKLSIDSILSFSVYPLKFVGYFWVFVILLSSLLLIFMTISRFVAGNPLHITNTAFFVMSNLFISWVTLSALGVLALYIASIHEEIRQRPLYIVKQRVNFTEE